MAGKIALQGFSRVKMFPVTQNDADGYTVGEGFSLPWAQEMTKEPDVTETKIYADDTLYLDLKSWNGINSTITLAEMTLEMIAEFGFGEYDETAKTLKAKPQGKSLQFAVTFRCLRADGFYRMYKFFSFTVTEIRESATRTKGEGGELNTYQIIGTFSNRITDDTPYEVKDAEAETDLTWLDTVETV